MTSAALGRFVMAMLYMDDTTLVERSKVGLQSLTEKYMHFCKMFRMRLNHKKSKVMHYRRVFKDGEDAGYEAGGVRFEQPKAPEKTPANARMGRTQPYLGFLTDECLSGKAHHSRALAIGHAQARKVGEVSAKMGEDMGLMYLKGVVGPKVLYDMELTGVEYTPTRIRQLWEKLLSKATLVADDDERGAYMTRRDAFTRKSGLMSETAEVPWDIQVQGRASGLWRRIKSQRNTLAGKAFTKPVVQGTTRQALGHHMDALGMPKVGGYSKGEWKQLMKDKMSRARKARLTLMVAESKKDGPQRSDEAYMQGVTPAGQVGQWARLVPAFGTRVKYRRFRLGLMDGSAQMVSRRTHKFDSVKADLPADVLHCPTCGVLESGNHVLLHCPRTEAVWDHAIQLAGEAVRTTPAERRWTGMTRERQIGHLLSTRELVDLPTEVALRGASTQALVSGLSCVDAQLKVDREPIRAMAAAAVKCKRAGARAESKAAQGGPPSPRSLVVTEDGGTPLTPVAGEAAAGGPAQHKDPEA